MVSGAITKRKFYLPREELGISWDQRGSLDFSAPWLFWGKVLDFPESQFSFQKNGDNYPFLESQETNIYTQKTQNTGINSFPYIIISVHFHH